MTSLVDRLKSMKSLKSLKTLHVAQVEVESDVTETPSDPSVKEAEAHLPEVSPSSSYEESTPVSNVIQTPTCPEAAEAVADLEPAPRAPSSLLSSFSRKAHRPSRHSVEWGLAASEPAGPQKSLKSFHFGGSAKRGSGKWLAPSRSSPNLGGPPKGDTLCVLGKECRSRRRLQTADGEAGGPEANLAELKVSSPGSPTERGLERKSSSTVALYKLVNPLPSPFLDQPLAGDSAGTGQDGLQTPVSSDGTEEMPVPRQPSMTRQGSPPGPGLERRRLSRKIDAAGKVVVSTEPLEEEKGDIMLPPQVVDFAADALANMGGSYTGAIEFSGGSARAIRRLSRNTSQEELVIPSRASQGASKTEIAAA